MSYEKKIKDLMARLVSMSPEPPPYPEEMPMARHESSKSPRPLLVFAAAAVVVIALAVPLLLFSGESPVADDTTTTTTTPAPTSTTPAPTSTTPEVTPTTVEDTTDTTLAAEVWESVVYLIVAPENSFLGNPALVPVTIRVEDPSGGLSPDAYFTEALTAGGSLPSGFDSAIPPAVELLDVTPQDIDGATVWVADMNEAFRDGAGGLLADYTMLNQLIYTITQGTPEIDQVLFTVNGEPVEAFGSEGLVLAEPVGRDDFIENLNPIFLNQPLVSSNGTYPISGMANVFEASVSIAVIDGAGEVVHEEFVTASCGTGCWGEFSTEIDGVLITPGESSIQVFTHSGEDGSPIDVVTVPIPSEGTWQLSVEDQQTEAPQGGTDQQEDPAADQPSEEAEDAFDVIADFIDAWKAGDGAGMRQASASDLPDSDIQSLIDLGTPAGEPYECRLGEDDDGLVAQCYIEIPDHGQYEQETHYVLARPGSDGAWEVTWAAVLTD